MSYGIVPSWRSGVVVHIFVLVFFFFFCQQSPEGDVQTLTEVDLFISTQRIKVLNADTQVSSCGCLVIQVSK